MLRSNTSTMLARKLCVKTPVLSRWRPMQPCMSILYINHYPTDFQIATFTRTPINFKYKDPKEREVCPIDPPPPPPPPKDDTLLWATIALLFGTGCFTVYAKNNPEVRDWLTLNASWFDDFIAIVFQENMTYGEFVSACIDDTKRFLDRYKDKQDTKPKECSTDGGLVKVCPPEPPKEVKPPPPPCEQPVKVERKSLCEVEKCMIELADCALNNYYTAKEACACYNRHVQDTMTTFTYKDMKDLRHAMEERKELVKTSLNNASNCLIKLDDLARYVECGTTGTKDQVNNTKLMYQDYNVKLKAAFMEYQWENDKSVEVDKQWQMVEQQVDKYTSANENMYNGLTYMSKKPNATGDLDALFTNSLRYIQEFQSQLDEASNAMTERIDRAIQDLPQKRSPEFVSALAKATTNAKAAAVTDFKKREDEQKKRNDQELEKQIKKQNDLHEKSLTTKLIQIEEQVLQKFNKLVDDKVAEERAALAAELKEMSTKLKAAEDKLEERLKAERETRRSQELWAAGASLLAATKKGDRYVRVDKELKAIEKASGDHDKLVLTVLKSIPKSIRENGIVPESVLRDRFHTMEKTARSVALVEQEGAPMPVYILSWLQGLLLFMKIRGIPQGEFEKPPLEPSPDLDTFDLLQRARFWIDRGNLAIAVRYVESLKGASRAAAHTWFEEARAHLEVRQAAEAVLAHAAALGLRYI